MFKLIGSLLAKLGKVMEDRSSTYEPQYEGRWRNIAKGKNEDWVWVEPKPDRKYVVNVFNFEDDYILTVGTKVKGTAIDHMECRDMKEVETTISILKTYYGTLGNVIISNENE